MVEHYSFRDNVQKKIILFSNGVSLVYSFNRDLFDETKVVQVRYATHSCGHNHSNQCKVIHKNMVSITIYFSDNNQL